MEIVMNKMLNTLRNSLPAMIAATLIASPAFAQEPGDRPPPGPRPERPEVRKRMMEMLDADKDGTLNETEQAAAQAFR